MQHHALRHPARRPASRRSTGQPPHGLRRLGPITLIAVGLVVAACSGQSSEDASAADEPAAQAETTEHGESSATSTSAPRPPLPATPITRTTRPTLPPPVTVPGPYGPDDYSASNAVYEQYKQLYQAVWTDPPHALALAEEIGTERLKQLVRYEVESRHSAGVTYVLPSQDRLTWGSVQTLVADAKVSFVMCLTDGIQMYQDGVLVDDEVRQYAATVNLVRTVDGWRLEYYGQVTDEDDGPFTPATVCN